LWEQGAHAGRERFDPPEILTTDLAPLVLALAQWGVADPNSLAWLDPPPAATLSAARARLAQLDALDREGRITDRGRSLAALPMEPWQAAMVLYGAEHAAAGEAARLALLLQERGLGGRGEDLAQRLARWNGDRSLRAEASRKLAANWASRASALRQAQGERGGEGATDQSEESRPEPGKPQTKSSEPQPQPARPELVGSEAGAQPQRRTPPLGVLLAMALPDNLARRRDASGESWLSAGGRGYALDAASPLAAAEWLAIGDAQGRAQAARITAALPLTSEEVERWLAPRIERRSSLRWTGERVEARLERRIGAIVLASGPDPAPDAEAVVEILVGKAVENLGKLVSPALLARAGYAGVDALHPDRLAAEAHEWLAPLVVGRRDLDLPRAEVTKALLDRLPWAERQRLDAAAPYEFTSPAGTHHVIDYAGDDAPSAEVRVQALFGLERHPMIGDTPLLLKLTSPAGRPIQATRDLPGFWRGSWADVKKEMKGRYPKHRWPDEPWAESPSLKTRNAFERS
jgi:ATP-dependent helicase HrpB